MVCFTLAQALWLRGKLSYALFVGSFAVLVAWPFAALPFVPMGVCFLLDTQHGGFVRTVRVGLISLVLFGLLPSAVDSWFYGKPVSPTLQMILYSALGGSGGGAHLYGVEPWSFYLKNLALNFNLVVIGSVVSLAFSSTVRKYHGVPFLMHFLLFQSMAHKEERFLFVLFPTLCWSCAVAMVGIFCIALLLVCV
jgi:alpha-1,2-mannosyltransferase